MTTAKSTRSSVVQVNNDDIVWIKNKLSEMDIMLHKLNATVVGDTDYGQEGLISKVKEHAQYIERNEKFKSKIVGGGIVLGAVWTALLKFWDKIFAA